MPGSITSLAPPTALLRRFFPQRVQGADLHRDHELCAWGTCRSWDCSSSCFQLGSSGPDSWWADPACCQADAAEEAYEGLLLHKQMLQGNGLKSQGWEGAETPGNTRVSWETGLGASLWLWGDGSSGAAVPQLS